MYVSFCFCLAFIKGDKKDKFANLKIQVSDSVV